MQQMDAPNEPPVDNPLPNGNRGRNRPDLTDTVRNRIVTFFLENCSIVDGVHVPARGTTVAAANFFNIDRTTAAKIWKNASDNRNDPSVGYYTSIVQRKGRCGPKVKYDPIELEEALVDLPKENRKTIRGVNKYGTENVEDKKYKAKQQSAPADSVRRNQNNQALVCSSTGRSQ